MSEKPETEAAFRLTLVRMLARGKVREHFHAGAMAALRAYGTPDEMAAQIMRDADSYAESVEP